MKATNDMQEQLGQLAGKSTEALALWADATQKVFRELVDLFSVTAKEGVRLYSELQSGAVEAVRERQAAWLRGQRDPGQAWKDPVAWYQQTLVEGIEATQQSFKLLEGNAQAITRSAGRLQTTAEPVAKEIQEAYVELGSRLKTLYTPSAN